MTTEFESHLLDATFPERETVEVRFNEVDFDDYDTLPAVFLFTAPTGERCVISPFIVPNAMAIEVVRFDADGHETGRALLQ